MTYSNTPRHNPMCSSSLRARLVLAKVSTIVHPRVVTAALGCWFSEGDAAAQFEWRRSNFNMLTSIGRFGKEFGTPNIKNLPCTIRKQCNSET